MLELLFLVCMVVGSAWSLKAARSTGEILVGLMPVGMFVFSWFAGGVAHALAGEWVGLGVGLGVQLVALLMLVVIGNRFRARRMSEIIQAA